MIKFFWGRKKEKKKGKLYKEQTIERTNNWGGGEGGEEGGCFAICNLQFAWVHACMWGTKEKKKKDERELIDDRSGQEWEEELFLVWSGLVWSGLVWSGLAWFGLAFAVSLSLLFIHSFMQFLKISFRYIDLN